MIVNTLIAFGDDVWVNCTEIAAVEPYRDVWGAPQEETYIVLKSGERVRVRTNNVKTVLSLWIEAVAKINEHQL